MSSGSDGIVAFRSMRVSTQSQHLELFPSSCDDGRSSDHIASAVKNREATKSRGFVSSMSLSTILDWVGLMGCIRSKIDTNTFVVCIAAVGNRSG